MARSFILFLSLLGFLIPSSFAAVFNYDYDSDEDLQPCDPAECKPPNCSCFGNKPPKSFAKDQVPQFVMLTFDDAVTVENVKTYKKIANGLRKNKGNKCTIGLTFFVCHEYNDYQLTNELYRNGHEIAVHSITHESNTDNWKNSTEEKWKQEMVGMRQILNKFGKIPIAAITGHRAPFLQTAGDKTFKTLKNNDFLYDSSLPTRNYMDPPLWPYTLDYGFPQDCQIKPCPKSSFPGLWVVPMINYKRKDSKGGIFHCSMVDACVPYPETAEDTKTYLRRNFERHYSSNRAPFPVFLHEAWLKNEDRLQGYLDFLDNILQFEDVFIVTVQEVVEYMKNPIPLSEYKKNQCYASRRLNAGFCSEPENCYFPGRQRFMKSCVSCPRRYPWLGNPMGQVIKQ